VITRLLLTATAGVLLGLFIDQIYVGVIVLLALALGMQLRQLWLLDDWLRHRNFRTQPDSDGLWGDIISLVSNLHRRKLFHKKRIFNLFRELRRSTTSMPDGVVAINAAHEIVWFNRKAGELLGLRRKIDFGIRIAGLLRSPKFSRYLEKADFNMGVLVHQHLGEPISLEFQGVPYGEGQLFLLVRNVTRQNQIEIMRKDFIANASHELRSPLTVIAGYLEVLSTDPALAEQLREPVLEMRRQSERMTTILSDLLELSRLEATDEQVVGSAIDMPALFGVLRKDVAARKLASPEILLQIETADDLLGDLGLVHSAILNLLDNALKYAPDSSVITLRWSADSTGGHCTVIDTGPGIASEHLPRLTERFYRVDPSRARATGGSGLGLAIVRHVMQRHGGELKIHSLQGQGSSFTCHFPLQRLIHQTVANISDTRYSSITMA